MPMPFSYRHASKDWRACLAVAKDRPSTPTDTMTRTAVQGGLLTFRRRLTPAPVSAFTPVLPFADQPCFDAAARALQPDHNLTQNRVAAFWAVRVDDPRALDRLSD